MYVLLKLFTCIRFQFRFSAFSLHFCIQFASLFICFSQLSSLPLTPHTHSTSPEEDCLCNRNASWLHVETLLLYTPSHRNTDSIFRSPIPFNILNENRIVRELHHWVDIGLLRFATSATLFCNPNHNPTRVSNPNDSCDWVDNPNGNSIRVITIWVTDSRESPCCTRVISHTTLHQTHCLHSSVCHCVCCVWYMCVVCVLFCVNQSWSEKPPLHFLALLDQH
jgi:hypothetical protein